MGPGSTVRAGKTTIVTGEVHVKAGLGDQNGPSVEPDPENPPSAGEGNPTSTTRPEEITPTSRVRGSNSATGTQGAPPTSGMNEPSSNGQGR